MEWIDQQSRNIGKKCYKTTKIDDEDKEDVNTDVQEGERELETLSEPNNEYYNEPLKIRE